MVEIKPNMYVRTKAGIKQIYKIDNNKTKWKYLYKLKKQDGDGCVDLGVLSEEDIKKASFNIIDLIEIGDYVNGEEVIALRKDISERDIHMNSRDCNVLTDYSLAENWYFGINDEDIKSIVTHEQFEEMKYKVGE